MALAEPLVTAEEPWFPDTEEGKKRLGRVLLAMLVPEYALLPLFFHLGREQLPASAWALQACFVALSGCAQWYIAEDYKRPGSLVPSLAECGLDGEVKTVLSIPVPKGLHVPKQVFEFFAQLPNYIHVQQTAVVAGVGFATWTTALQEEYERRWQGVPDGHIISWRGIPGMLRLLVVFSFCYHTWFAVVTYCQGKLDAQADAANLLFLGARLAAKERQELGLTYSRFYLMVFVKLSLLYFKTSMAMLMWPCLTSVERWTNMCAISLGWYSCKPALGVGLQMCRGVVKVKPCWWVLFLGMSLFLACMAVHTLGIFLCDSHDLSLFHGGCTPPATQDFCRA